MLIYFEALKQNFLPYFKPLANYEFTFFNPLFWIFLLLLFLVLLLIWETKKSFQFCLLLAFILLCTTEIESRFVSVFSASGQLFDVSVLRLISLLVVLFMFLFYAFLL